MHHEETLHRDFPTIISKITKSIYSPKVWACTVTRENRNDSFRCFVRPETMQTLMEVIFSNVERYFKLHSSFVLQNESKRKGSPVTSAASARLL